MHFLRIGASSRAKEGLRRKGGGARCQRLKAPLNYAPANYPQALLKLSFILSSLPEKYVSSSQCLAARKCRAFTIGGGGDTAVLVLLNTAQNLALR